MAKNDWTTGIKVSTSDNKDGSIKIKVECIWESNGWSYSINNVTGKVTCNGTTKTVFDSGSISTSGGDKNLGSYTFTINKTKSTQSIACKAEITSKSTYVSGTKSASKNQSVSAKTSYTISYDGNGGSTPSNQTKWYGEDINLQGAPSRTGYSFNRWNTNTSNTGTGYAGGAKYTANSGVKLYAIWNANSYAINYNANGGSGAPGNFNKAYGSGVNLSNTRPNKTGYTFAGWKSSLTNQIYQPGAWFGENSTGTITLTAQWNINQYSVIYNGNGNTGGNTNSQTANYGTAINIQNNDFVKTNYDFVKWNTQSDGNGTNYYPGDSYTLGASNLNLYAIWKLAYLSPKIFKSGNDQQNGGIVVSRCDQNGYFDDTGEYISIHFLWEIDKQLTVSELKVEINKKGSDSGWQTIDSSIDTTGAIVDDYRRGLVNAVEHFYGDEIISAEDEYYVRVYIKDSADQSTQTNKYTISTTTYPIDILREGKGIAFGGVAKYEGYADFNFKVRTINKNFEAYHNFDDVPNEGVGFDAKYILNGTSDHMMFGVNSDGKTRGIYDSKLLRWPFKIDANNDVSVASSTKLNLFGNTVQMHANSLPTIKIGNNTYTVATKEPKYLWVNNGLYMGDTQTANLSENVTDQNNGIVLVFCEWDITNNRRAGWGYDTFFIPKSIVIPNINIGWDGVGMDFQMFRNNAPRAYKYLYVYNNKIVGNAGNVQTINNVDNRNKVLIAVIGV